MGKFAMEPFMRALFGSRGACWFEERKVGDAIHIVMKMEDFFGSEPIIIADKDSILAPFMTADDCITSIPMSAFLLSMRAQWIRDAEWRFGDTPTPQGVVSEMIADLTVAQKNLGLIIEGLRKVALTDAEHDKNINTARKIMNEYSVKLSRAQEEHQDSEHRKELLNLLTLAPVEELAKSHAEVVAMAEALEPMEQK